jgi:hypothetical protein
MDELPAKSDKNDQETAPLSEIEQPREGTLAWLQAQEHVEVDGVQLPAVHRVPEGATLVEPGSSCRVVRPDGSRCGAVPTRLYGVCISHLGGGAQDWAALAAAGHRGKTRLKMQRRLLGVSTHRGGSARQMARVAALNRAADVAEALLAPLDDTDLGSLSRQAAAVRILDATEPIQHASVEVELPSEADGVQGLSWQDMQALAARLLDEG